MKLTLVKYPDPILKKVCTPVERTDGKLPEEVVELGKKMLSLMYETRGVGLAAPQVGYGIRVLVMDCTPDKTMPVVLVNPVITESSEETLTMPEGCLSFPGLFFRVTRPRKVTVQAINVDGVDIEAQLDGFWARCLQHEIDHLDGKLFTGLAEGDALKVD